MKHVPVDLGLVGVQEIAALLDVPASTVSVWRHRGLLPQPWTIVSGRWAWQEAIILGWAETTGRMPEQRVAKPVEIVP